MSSLKLWEFLIPKILGLFKSILKCSSIEDNMLELPSKSFKETHLYKCSGNSYKLCKISDISKIEDSILEDYVTLLGKGIIFFIQTL